MDMWIAIVFTASVIANVLVVGILAYMVIQRERLYNPSLYRRQAVSEKVRTQTRPTIQPHELNTTPVGQDTEKSGIGGDDLLKKFVKDMK